MLLRSSSGLQPAEITAKEERPLQPAETPPNSAFRSSSGLQPALSIRKIKGLQPRTLSKSPANQPFSVTCFTPCASTTAAHQPYAAASSLAPRPSNPESGLTLIELIITVAIVSILSTAALPVAKFQVKRQKERELRRDLWEMRDAIDRYKEAADRGAIQVKADSAGYPPDLQTLVDGVDVGEKKVRFLRAIPNDPMTRSTEWGLRSNQDDADADSWGGQNVFDVYTKSYGTALDGSKYTTW